MPLGRILFGSVSIFNYVWYSPVLPNRATFEYSYSVRSIWIDVACK